MEVKDSATKGYINDVKNAKSIQLLNLRLVKTALYIFGFFTLAEVGNVKLLYNILSITSDHPKR
jgi:hypothetical protein